MTAQRRRSYESGHRPKFLVVIDGTPESDRAVHFAARRAARIGGSVVMLAVAEPPESFEWLGVGDAMREEAEEEAQALLETAAASARSVAGVDPEQIVRPGDRLLAIAGLIEEDEDIAFLVLAAGTAKEGPGPLVSGLAGKAASTFPIPIVIVPGSLTDEEIDALAG
ncbi:MAG TPA: universal stress protein [Beijerinckiaceae bacterium]|jgi:nucleotide-binding universal stress UspA family protein